MDLERATLQDLCVTSKINYKLCFRRGRKNQDSESNKGRCNG